jgi:lipopolysaccharide biosynthesis regulator YciM
VRQNYAKANDQFKKAVTINKKCVRAYLNMAKILIEIGQTKKALSYIQDAVNADPEMIPVCLKSLAKCFFAGQEEEHLEVLNSWLQISENPHLVIAISEIMAKTKTREEIDVFLLRVLKKTPSFELFSYVWERMYSDLGPEDQERFTVLKSIMDAHQVNNHRFMCHKCGFKSSVLFWQCPSCHNWETMKPHQITDWKASAGSTEKKYNDKDII